MKEAIGRVSNALCKSSTRPDTKHVSGSWYRWSAQSGNQPTGGACCRHQGWLDNRVGPFVSGLFLALVVLFVDGLQTRVCLRVRVRGFLCICSNYTGAALKTWSLCHLSTAAKPPQKQTTHKTKMISPNIKKRREIWLLCSLYLPFHSLLWGNQVPS